MVSKVVSVGRMINPFRPATATVYCSSARQSNLVRLSMQCNVTSVIVRSVAFSKNFLIPFVYFNKFTFIITQIYSCPKCVSIKITMLIIKLHCASTQNLPWGFVTICLIFLLFLKTYHIQLHCMMQGRLSKGRSSGQSENVGV